MSGKHTRFRSAREDAVLLLSVRQLPQGSAGPQLPDTKQKEGETGYGAMPEHSGDRQEAALMLTAMWR